MEQRKKSIFTGVFLILAGLVAYQLNSHAIFVSWPALIGGSFYLTFGLMDYTTFNTKMKIAIGVLNSVLLAIFLTIVLVFSKSW